MKRKLALCAAVLCLTMAAWDLVNTVRLLLVRRRGGETP